MFFWKRWFGRGAGGAAQQADDAAWDAQPEDRGWERRQFTAALRRQVESELRANGLPPAPDSLWRVLVELPRERFLPPAQRSRAYQDEPLPIGHGQTISPPFLIALMVAALAPRPNSRVLEIGAGSGYQTALLAGLAGRVQGVELVPELAGRARRTLSALGIRNAEIAAADGSGGWPRNAPYDCILANCASRHIPGGLLDQLTTGGRLVAPIGSRLGPQQLMLVEKKAAGRIVETALMQVNVGPMAGN